MEESHLFGASLFFVHFWHDICFLINNYENPTNFFKYSLYAKRMVTNPGEDPMDDQSGRGPEDGKEG